MRGGTQDAEKRNEAEGQFTLGSASINIQHLDTLIVQQCPLHRDTDGEPQIPGI